MVWLYGPCLWLRLVARALLWKRCICKTNGFTEKPWLPVSRRQFPRLHSFVYSYVLMQFSSNFTCRTFVLSKWSRGLCLRAYQQRHWIGDFAQLRRSNIGKAVLCHVGKLTSLGLVDLDLIGIRSGICDVMSLSLQIKHLVNFLREVSGKLC